MVLCNPYIIQDDCFRYARYVHVYENELVRLKINTFANPHLIKHNKNS